jgi:hypothetical protein
VLAGLALIAGTATITAGMVSQERGRGNEAWPDYTEPGKEHDVLDRLAGEWEFEVTAWVTPGSEPMTAQLAADYRWLFGGRFLVGEFEGFVGGERFRAKEVFGYDMFKKEYNALWIDNKTTAFQLSTGQFDSRRNALVMEGVQPDVAGKGGDHKFKVVYRFVNDDELVMEVHREREDRTMYKRAEVRGTRLE